MDKALPRVIDRACRSDSLYMIFLDADEDQRSEPREVEIRIDVASGRMAEVASCASVQGWRLAATAPDGRVFLRRSQSLLEPALHQLFGDALKLAAAHGGRFLSWMHAPWLEADV